MRTCGLMVVLALLVAAFWSPLVLASDEGAEIEAQYGVCTDRAMNDRLEKVSARVVMAYHQKYPKGKHLSFKILNDEELNACALEDGRIYVTSGMMNALKGKPDDDLAAVLSHEATHVGAKHHKGQMKNTIGGVLLGAAVVYVAGGDSEDIKTGAQIGGGLLGASRSKDDEYRADNGSVDLLVMAGYNPHATAEVMQMLDTKYGRGTAKIPLLGWFASHPDTKKRVEGAERYALQFQSGQVGSYTPPAGGSGSYQSVPPAPVSNGPRVIVVVDPQAGQSNNWGWGSSYYYNEDLSTVTKQETEVMLEKRGYQVLVSTRDVGPLQEEIDLENSEWGENGEGRTPKGEFDGAERVFYVSAYVMRDKRFGVGDWRNQVKAAGLTIGVTLREIDLRTRRQIRAYKGSGTALGITQIDVQITRSWWDQGVGGEYEQVDNLARKAISKAVNSAVPGGQNSPSNPPIAGGNNIVNKTQPANNTHQRPVTVQQPDVQSERQFTLSIRPKDRSAKDKRVVVAKFEATIQEVVLTNRINFYQGNTVIAVVDINWQASNPESGTLEGTLYAPTWTSLNLSGVTSIRLVEHR